MRRRYIHTYIAGKGKRKKKKKKENDFCITMEKDADDEWLMRKIFLGGGRCLSGKGNLFLLLSKGGKRGVGWGVGFTNFFHK